MHETVVCGNTPGGHNLLLAQLKPNKISSPAQIHTLYLVATEAGWRELFEHITKQFGKQFTLTQ